MGAIETVGIVKELMEIWPNEVCDTGFMFVALIVVMYLLKLKKWLISNLVLEPL